MIVKLHLFLWHVLWQHMSLLKLHVTCVLL